MAKRVNFIAGIEAMRGNVSGKQKLLYPTNNNKAYDAPLDKRSYANNYRPSYVFARRAKDGLVYFSVKTKHAVKNTILTLKNMAAMACAQIGYLIMVKIISVNEPALLDKVKAAFIGEGGDWAMEGLRKYIIDKLRNGLMTGTHFLFSTPGGSSVEFYNPFVNADAESYEALYNRDDVSKYVQNFVAFCAKWWVLAPSGITFKVRTEWGILECLGYNGIFSGLLTFGTAPQKQYGWGEGPSSEIDMQVVTGGVTHHLNLKDEDGDIMHLSDTINPNIVYDSVDAA